MKYYHYLSESKINMLFPQVPHATREKISAEIGFNIGLVSAKVGSEATLSDDLVTRLQVVEQYLANTQALGSVKAPREWFSGEMTARTMGLWTGGGAVFFLGTTADVLVALGGSMRNMLGGEHFTHGGPSLSNLAPLMEALEAFVTDEMATGEPVLPDQLFRSPRVKETLTWPELVKMIENKPRVPTERVHFVARLLTKGRAGEQRVLLGTPLYVAAGSSRGV